MRILLNQHRRLGPHALAFVLSVCLITRAGLADTVRFIYPRELPQVVFAVAELDKALRSRGLEPVTAGAAALRSESRGRCICFVRQSDTRLLELAGLRGRNAVPRLASEGYALRSGRPASPQMLCVVGADAAGLMYGGLELAELITIGVQLDAVADVEHEPYFAMRGTKFNIPLDVRTPSYSDVSDAAQQNIPVMWDFKFWQEYLDTLARYRYNFVSLWSLHPFPSLVKLPDFPGVALDDVQRSTVPWQEHYSLNGLGFDAPEILANVERVERMTIDEKIAFWRKVMRYGKDRNIDFYFVTWNIFVNGTGGQYGITDGIDNAITRRYFRQSVKQMFLTYPDLAGIGLTTGENMPRASRDEKEDWAFDTYGRGVLDAAREQPERKLTFIHRQHQTGAQEIARKFAPLREQPGVEFIFSFKYAKAHVFSATSQPYHERFVREIGDLKTIWTLRNDDNYYFRWGAPDFVREFLQNIPRDPSRGFYYGSDQYVWGREFLSLEPERPRQIEVAKHWYHWMLWGRLGFDPTLDNDRFQRIIQSRFPSVPADELFTAWQQASLIYPLTTGFHWGALDFQWYIEGCQSRPGPAETQSGFHDVNRFITLAPHPRADCLGVNEYLAKKRSSAAIQKASPAAVADRIQTHADHALQIVDRLFSDGDRELRKTLNDIRAMAHLGSYYAHKIRAAQELGEHRLTGEPSHQQRAVEELNAAARCWRYYASTALGQYRNPLWTNRVGHVDWRVTYEHVLHDVEIAGGRPAVRSLTPTPGGHILQAEAGRHRGWRVAAQRTGYSGSGYLEMVDDSAERFVEWTVEAAREGTCVLELQYALLRDGLHACPVVVNGQQAGKLVCWTTGGPNTWAWDRKLVTLKPGANTIRILPPSAVLVDHLNVMFD